MNSSQICRRVIDLNMCTLLTQSWSQRCALTVRTLYHLVDVLREDKALQVAVKSSPLSITSESFGTTTAGSRSAQDKRRQDETQKTQESNGWVEFIHRKRHWFWETENWLLTVFSFAWRDEVGLWLWTSPRQFVITVPVRKPKLMTISGNRCCRDLSPHPAVVIN